MTCFWFCRATPPMFLDLCLQNLNPQPPGLINATIKNITYGLQHFTSTLVIAAFWDQPVIKPLLGLVVLAASKRTNNWGTLNLTTFQSFGQLAGNRRIHPFFDDPTFPILPLCPLKRMIPLGPSGFFRS